VGWAATSALTAGTTTTFYATLQTGASGDTGFGPVTLVDGTACTSITGVTKWVGDGAGTADGCIGDILTFYNAQPTGTTSASTSSDLVTAGATYEVQISPPPSASHCGSITLQAYSNALTTSGSAVSINPSNACGTSSAALFAYETGTDVYDWAIYFEQSTTGSSTWCIQTAAEFAASFGNCNGAFSIIKTLAMGIGAFLGITLFL